MKYLCMNNISGAVITNKTTKTQPQAKKVNGLNCYPFSQCAISPSSYSYATIHNGVNWKIAIWLIFLEHFKMVCFLIKSASATFLLKTLL